MDTKSGVGIKQMAPLAWLLFLLLPSLTNAYVYNLNLQISQTIATGQTAIYRCSSTPRSNTNEVIYDPIFQWDIRKDTSVDFGTNMTGFSSLVSETDTRGGAAISEITFTVQADQLNQILYCSAYKPSECCASDPDISIYNTLIETTASIGVRCATPQRECISHAHCNSNGVCDCDTGYIATSSTNCAFVQNTARVGQSCGSTVGCSTVNSFCSTNSGTCVCNNNLLYYQSSNGCYAAQTYDQSCITTDQSVCTGTSNTYCLSTSGTSGNCKCKSGYSYNGATCITAAVTVGNACSICSAGSTSCVTCSTASSSCVNNLCQCNSGLIYYSSTNECKLARNYGESCNTIDGSTACTGISNMVCNINSGGTYTCTCLSNYMYSGGACVQQGNLGGTCTFGITSSCQDSAASCISTNINNVISYRCTCNSGYYDNNGDNSGGSCVAKVNLGGTCPFSITSSCQDSSASCTSTNINNVSTYRCTCNSGYYDNNGDISGGSCVAKGGVGSSCTIGVSDTCSDQQSACTYQSSSTSYRCLCKSNYYDRSGTCTQKIQLGVSCQSTYSGSCSDSNAECVQVGTTSSYTCQCKNGYLNSGGTCQLNTITATANCLATTQVPATTLGSASAPTTPDVTVPRTCYEVNLQATVQLNCSDTASNRGVIQFVEWNRSNGSRVVQSTGEFINGVTDKPHLTISSAKAWFADQYRCKMCYSQTDRCTYGPYVTVHVIGARDYGDSNCNSGSNACTASANLRCNGSGVCVCNTGYVHDGTICQLDVPSVQSVTISTTPSTRNPQKGSSLTMTCTTTPTDSTHTKYQYSWRRNNVVDTNLVSYQFTLSSIQPANAGDYKCTATHNGVGKSSATMSIDVQYAPEFSGGATVIVNGDTTGALVNIDCTMTANPAVTRYQLFSNVNGNLLSSSTTVNNNPASGIFQVSGSSYGVRLYKCQATNSLGSSEFRYFTLQAPAASTGASTEEDGLATGTIAAIVLGLIFLLLLIIIIIVCCCSYGWCRKKEKVEPVVVEKPLAKPYIPRCIVSASSTVTRKDVGIMVNGYPDASVSTDYEEQRYATPRYHLKPATSTGPIISMFDDTYDQPRPHQIPALDTQYLYTEEAPKKRRKHRRKKHRHSSPRRSYEPQPVQERVYTAPPSDDDLVVVPGNSTQNYFE